MFVEPYELVSTVHYGDVVLDVGANIGSFTKQIVKKAKRVIAIEPEPLNFRYLTRYFGNHQKVTLINKAVWNSSGILELKLSTDHGKHSFFKENVDTCYSR